MTRDTFLDAIEQFLRDNEARGWTASRFGKEAMNDPNFVFNIRNGRSPSLKVVEKVLAFIEAKRAEPEQAGAA